MVLHLTLKGCCDNGNSENTASSTSVKKTVLSQVSLLEEPTQKSFTASNIKQGSNTSHTYITICGC